MADLIKPKTVEIKDTDGIEHSFIISRLPATVGSEILKAYPLTSLPKVGDLTRQCEYAAQMMCYVAVAMPDGRELRLTTKALADNHIPDGESYIKLEAAMLQYNCSFFQKGVLSTFLETWTASSLGWITKTLTRYLGQSSARGQQRSKS